MATVINNPPSSDGGEKSGTGVIVAVALILLVLALLFGFGIPAFRNRAPEEGSSVQQPQQNITVPDEIDVNVRTQAPQQ